MMLKRRCASTRSGGRARGGGPRARRAGAVVAGASLVAASVFAGAAPASARPTDTTEALGRFLGGDVGLGGVDLDAIAEVEGADAARPSGAARDTDPLSAAVLGTLGVEVGGGLSLLGDDGLVRLGAVNQYAAADADGAAAAAGAVNDSGAIEVGGSAAFPADATVDLAPLLAGAGLDGVVSDVALQLGALSATATDTRAGDPVGDYRVAGGSLVLDSPAVAALAGTVTDDVLPPVQTALDSLGGPDGTVAATLESLAALRPVLDALGAGLDPTVALEADLAGAVAPVLADRFGDAGVVLDLAAGTVTVDLDTVLGERGGLNGLPPNAELFDAATLDAILDALAAALDDLAVALVDAISTAVRDATLAVRADAALGGLVDLDIDLTGTLAQFVDGTLPPGQATVSATLGGLPVLGLDAAALVGPVGALLDDALLGDAGLLATVGDTVTTTVTEPVLAGLSPVLDAVADVASVTLNVQVTPGDLPAQDPAGTASFTQRALSVRLLSLGTGTDLATVDLASATVRVLDAPAITADPATVPASGTTTVTGTGFTPGGDVTLRLTDADGAPAGMPVVVTAAGDGTIDVGLPVAAGTAAGDFVVTATDPAAGTATAALTVTPAPTVAVDPGTVPAGGRTSVTGTGFTPGAATVQLTDADGDPVGDPVTVELAEDGTTTGGTLAVPGDTTPGALSVVVTDAVGAHAAAPLTVTAPPAVTADPAALEPGDITTVTGTGFTPGAAVTLQPTDPAGEAVGDPLQAATDGEGGFRADVPLPADAVPGTWTVVATDPSGAAAGAPVSVVDPAVGVDPATVPAGGTTTVTGTGFTAGGDVTLRLTDADGVPVGEPVTVAAGDGGAMSADLPVPPDAAPGDHTIVATDVTLGLSATAALTVTAAPVVVVDPSTVAAGDSTTVTGEGFTPGTDVAVGLADADGEPLGATTTVTTDHDGGFTVEHPVPDDAPAGDLTVVVTDPTTGQDAEAPLTVVSPSASVDPGSVPAGGTTTVEGDGFAPGQGVTVAVTGPDGAVVDKTVTAGADGSVSVDITVPAGATPGDHVVTVTDETTGASTEVPLTVTPAPTVEVTPPTAQPGDTVVVIGDGFTPDREVVVVVVGNGGGAGDGSGDGSGDVVVGPVTVATDDEGRAQTEVVLPPLLPPGGYTVVVTDPSGARGEASLTVQPGVTGPTDPDGRALHSWFGEPVARPGDTQELHAAGFRPGEQVRAVVSSTPLALPTTLADADGVAHWTFTVPATFEEGVHTGTATSLSAGDSTTATFEVVVAATGDSSDASGTGWGGGSGGWGGGSGTLARTGADDVATLLAVALALVAAGAATVVATRSRRVRAAGPRG
jgi:hypothetical protein